MEISDQDNPEKAPDFVETMIYTPTEAVCMTGRFLLGSLMQPTVSLLKATQCEAIRNYYHEMHVIQDMLVPFYRVGDAWELVNREMEPWRYYSLICY
ncbi:delta(24)-sterol reductase-like [Olea europaea subsp. europaea]|uniref:Delta(24)-sterol reductase-like n=1 Tax=Olea europaea subsp. europaea TaxID=158383 RepID=A0A8S0RRZ8_OLEEU|nr:delta(24)-sterol reductase-like [Olea europaea subsp. europaea]